MTCPTKYPYLTNVVYKHKFFFTTFVNFANTCKYQNRWYFLHSDIIRMIASLGSLSGLFCNRLKSCRNLLVSQQNISWRES